VFVDRVVARTVFDDCVLTVGGGAAWGEGVFGLREGDFVG